MTLDASTIVSVIIPVGARQSPIAELYADYKSGLKALGVPFEMIFVLDGPQPACEAALLQMHAQGEPVTIVTLTRHFGEATAVMIGFDHAVGEVILTLPAHLQVEGSQISQLVAALESVDIAVGCRKPRASTWFQAMRRGALHRGQPRATSRRPLTGSGRSGS